VGSEPGDVVVVPFPFTEKAGQKRRPALVLSRRAFNARGHSASRHDHDWRHHSWRNVEIRDRKSAGLPSLASSFRLFTLDNRLILRRSGAAPADRQLVSGHLRR
jgi:mRNA interferase MazF